MKLQQTRPTVEEIRKQYESNPEYKKDQLSHNNYLRAKFTDEEFAEIWNSARTVDEVVKITGYSKQYCHKRAYILRLRGFEVKYFPYHREDYSLKV